MKTFISPKGYYYKISKKHKIRISKIEYLKYNKSGGSYNTSRDEELGDDIYKRKDGSYYYYNKESDKIELGSNYDKIDQFVDTAKGNFTKEQIQEHFKYNSTYIYKRNDGSFYYKKNHHDRIELGENSERIEAFLRTFPVNRNGKKTVAN
jgi:hypothetical protein